ncbi:MAG: hypothetical protein GF417_14050 [Candidatus Latescibacteria bacterium]|nr:hypothetical protein [Candidatus Latescibacterota bacterium]
MVNYLYIVGTILFTVFGQLIIKWRINIIGELPSGFTDKISFLFGAIIDPYVMSGLVAAFMGALCWIAAMTKFEISYAYPFMSLSFVLVFFLSIFLFGEIFTWGKTIGMLMVISGLIVMVKL